jgi:hypothetical protein
MMEKCFDEGTLQAFLDNELALELSQKVARHVADCDLCAILLAEVEEETAFAFAALEQEFSTLVPTQRLWTKINQSIESESRPRGFWQYVLTFVSGFSLTNPSVAAFASLLFIIATLAVLIGVKSNIEPDLIASNQVTPTPSAVPTTEPNKGPTPEVAVNRKSEKDEEVIDELVEAKEPNITAPKYRIEKANFVENNRKAETAQSVNPNRDIYRPPVEAPQYLPGEESYISTISSLEKTVESNKEEVLNPSSRFAFEKDMAIVNDAIKKMKSEVRRNPKNEGAKQVLFASYQNKIDLLSSVAERSELMVSLR